MIAFSALLKPVRASRSRRRRLLLVATGIGAAILADLGCNFAHDPRLTVLGLGGLGLVLLGFARLRPVSLSGATIASERYGRRGVFAPPSPSFPEIETRP